MSGVRAAQSEDIQWLFRIIACFAVFAAALVLIFLYDYKIMQAMLRDRAEWGAQPFYLGAISQIGILTWAAGAAIALFTVAVAEDETTQPEKLTLLRCIGLFSLILCLDDVFQVHEVVAPRYLYIDQKAVLLLYALSALIIAFTFRRQLLKRPVLPAAAVSALAISMGLDLTEPYWPNLTIQLLVEDTFKQLGILLWTSFIIQQALAVLTSPRAVTLAPNPAEAEAEIRLPQAAPQPAIVAHTAARASTGVKKAKGAQGPFHPVPPRVEPQPRPR
ncbi:MAG TPA: hypothetical protein VIG90_19485 [Pedomonas sp.]|uniref:hypothetical protein n=1 Tax=Pedomonas sp. TaxID=2976421 RepID=UPI002F3F84C2